MQRTVARPRDSAVASVAARSGDKPSPAASQGYDGGLHIGGEGHSHPTRVEVGEHFHIFVSLLRPVLISKIPTVIAYHTT